MIKIEPMNGNHIEGAVKIAIQNYHEERNIVKELPEGDYTQLLTAKIEKHMQNGLGVTAVENGNLLGFLTCWKPMKNHFGTTLGTFSPIHTHGTVRERRGEIYSRLYQSAAEKWVGEGILSHAIALYSHDKEAVHSFFWNGFGVRCVDAIRNLSPIAAVPVKGCVVKMATLADAEQILQLFNALRAHLQQTPMFIPLFTPGTLEEITKWMAEEGNYYMAAFIGDKIVAYLKLTDEGENFACSAPDMINICGAYCMPEYRGQGIMQYLLNEVILHAAHNGFQRIGVDFESFNPNAAGFWLKYFNAYTYSVVRRIDERIIREIPLPV